MVCGCNKISTFSVVGIVLNSLLILCDYSALILLRNFEPFRKFYKIPKFITIIETIV